MIDYEEPVPFAHYSDARFNYESGWKAVTVWGHEHPDTFYNYDDRLYGERREIAVEAANVSGKATRSPAWWREMLAAFYDAPDLEMHHVLTGVNQATGYQYTVLGYKYTPRAQRGQA